MVVLTITVRGVVEQELTTPKTKSHDSAATKAANHRVLCPRRFTHSRRTPSPLVFAQRFVNDFDQLSDRQPSTEILQTPRWHNRGAARRTSERGRHSRNFQMRAQIFFKESFT